MSLITRLIIGIASYFVALQLFSDVSSSYFILQHFPISWFTEDFPIAFLPDFPLFRYTRFTLLTDILFGAIVIWNIFVYILYRIDKRRAAKGEWRIKEKTLLWCAVIFGAIGAWEGVFHLRHKSKHWNFKIIISLSMFIQLIILFSLLRLNIIAWDVYRYALNI